MKKLMATLTVALCALAGFGAHEAEKADWHGTITDDYPSAGLSYALAEPNSTNYVGGLGGAYPNGQGRFIELQEGSVLIVTQKYYSATAAGSTLWANIIATNGHATIEWRSTTGALMNPSSQGHVFCGKDTGSLTIRTPEGVSFGHDEKWCAHDLRNVRFDYVNSSGTGYYTIDGSTLYSLPAYDTNTYKRIFAMTKPNYEQHLAGPDVFTNDEVVVSAANFVLFNTTAIPASKTIRIQSGASVRFVNFDLGAQTTTDDPANFPSEYIFSNFSLHESTTVLTNMNPIIVEEGGELIFSNLTHEIVCAGPISGAGKITINRHKQIAYSSPVARLAGDNSGFTGTICAGADNGATLWLDHANAAANATIDTANGLSVKVNPAVTNATIGELTGEGDTVCSFPLAEGQKLTIKEAAGLSVKKSGKGEIVLNTSAERWKDKVSLWFDFSKTNTLYDAGMSTIPGESSVIAIKIDAYRRIEHVVDWRDANKWNTLWNRRGYMSDGTKEWAESVYPLCMPGGPNGLTYLKFSATGNRRIPFNTSDGDGKKYNNCVAIKPALVVMVFGSAQGGGMAILGTEDSHFQRNSDVSVYPTLSDPISLKKDKDMWLDGEKIDPSTTCFTTEKPWQVISVDTTDLNVTGIGPYLDHNKKCAGQNYGELIIFNEMPTEYERRSAEEYLATKWGLTANYKPGIGSARRDYAPSVTNTVSATGAGVVESDDTTLDVTGYFRGTVKLGGGTLVVKPGLKPYTADQIPTANLEYWIDPDRADCVDTVNTSGTIGGQSATLKQVYALADRNGRTDAFFKSNGTRGPLLINEARGEGVAHNWVNFRRMFDGADDKGRNMRTAGTRAGSAILPAAQFPVQTAFIAMDSVYGGGTPICDALYGNGDLKNRSKQPYTSPIWASGAIDAVKNGTTRLNGAAVNGATDGFTGAPDVLSFAWKNALTKQWFLDHHEATVTNTWCDSLVLGEALYYSTTNGLTEADVKGIEAYLMKKWTGTLPAGYAALDEMTVTGSGTVDVLAGADMPQIASTFSGSIAVGGESAAFTMTVDPTTGAVTGALAFDNATVTLPSEVTLTVSMTETPAKSASERRYLLARATGVTQWNLTKGANVPSKATLEVKGDKVYLVLPPTGLIIQFR